MRDFVKPLIIENNEMFEGVYALDSGLIPNAHAWVTWDNHNSGSHSDLSAWVQIDSQTGGSYIKLTVTFVGRGVIENVGGSGLPDNTSMTWSGNSIIFIRNAHFNPNEKFQFNFNNVVFSETGDDHDVSEHKGSYYETNTHIGDASGDFVVDVQVA